MLISIFVLTANAGYGDTLRISHCLAGCPQGANEDNDLVIRTVYALSFNHANKVADWVAYRVTAESIGVATNLSRVPVVDPFVPDALVEEDFRDSRELSGVERTNFTPLVSFAGTPYWAETNYLSNMVPRNPELNRGSWYGLEWAVRNLASRTGELYVITGPLYDQQHPHAPLGTDKQHAVPTGFYKVVANAEGAVTAFTFDQELPFYVHHCDQRVELQEVEQRSGLDLFPEAPQWPSGELDQQLGCN